MSILWGAVAGQRVFNAFDGGDVSTFTYSGGLWRRHLFEDFGEPEGTVLANPQPFRVTMIAGGGESGFMDPLAGEGSPGGSGGGVFLETALPVGPLAMQVGRQAAGAYVNVTANDTKIDGIGTVGGGGHGQREWNGTQRTNGRPGTWGGNSNGGNGQSGGAYVSPNDPSAALRTLVDGAVGLWGRYGAGKAGGGPGGTNPGYDGLICIEYRIG